MGAMFDVYLERGRKRVFAGGIDWPGWCRSGPDEQDALQALVEYAPRYLAAIKGSAGSFKPPRDPSALQVVEVLEGNSTTDFGAPGIPPSADSEHIDERRLRRLIAIVQSSWDAFDASVKAAASKALRTGPRGGGRDIPKMRAHVLEADASYLSGVGGSFRPKSADAAEMKRLRKAFVEALLQRARGELPDKGPRGGVRWSAPYAIRRSAWHALDHAWEIEDRST
jgi:hypothetical protein